MKTHRTSYQASWGSLSPSEIRIKQIERIRERSLKRQLSDHSLAYQCKRFLEQVFDWRSLGAFALGATVFRARRFALAQKAVQLGRPLKISYQIDAIALESASISAWNYLVYPESRQGLIRFAQDYLGVMVTLGTFRSLQVFVPQTGSFLTRYPLQHLSGVTALGLSQKFAEALKIRPKTSLSQDQFLSWNIEQMQLFMTHQIVASISPQWSTDFAQKSECGLLLNSFPKQVPFALGSDVLKTPLSSRPMLTEALRDFSEAKVDFDASEMIRILRQKGINHIQTAEGYHQRSLEELARELDQLHIKKSPNDKQVWQAWLNSYQSDPKELALILGYVYANEQKAPYYANLSLSEHLDLLQGRHHWRKRFGIVEEWDFEDQVFVASNLYCAGDLLKTTELESSPYEVALYQGQFGDTLGYQLKIFSRTSRRLVAYLGFELGQSRIFVTTLQGVKNGRQLIQDFTQFNGQHPFDYLLSELNLMARYLGMLELVGLSYTRNYWIMRHLDDPSVPGEPRMFWKIYDRRFMRHDFVPDAQVEGVFRKVVSEGDGEDLEKKSPIVRLIQSALINSPVL